MSVVYTIILECPRGQGQRSTTLTGDLPGGRWGLDSHKGLF